jgi:hypothetical protein
MSTCTFCGRPVASIRGVCGECSERRKQIAKNRALIREDYRLRTGEELNDGDDDE